VTANGLTQSTCVPCGDPLVAFSVGDGLELASCVCPPGMYITRGSVAIACTACPAAPPVCGVPQQLVPDTCWTGRQIGAPACACPVAPFSADASACGVTSTCAVGFSLAPPSSSSTPGGSTAVVALPTGSALYVERTTAAWSRLVSEGAQCGLTFDCAIRRIAVTSDLGLWGDAYNYQFVLWTLSDPYVMHVYGVPLPPNDIYADAYTLDVWVVVPPLVASNERCTLEDIAVAPWSVPQTPAQLVVQHVSVPTYAIAIVASFVDDYSWTLWAYFNTLSVSLVDGTGTVAWGTPSPTRAALFPTSPALYSNATVVSTVGLTPSSSTTTGPSSLFYFYVAFNAPAIDGVRASATCGVVTVSTSAESAVAQLTLTSAGGGGALQLYAMAALPAPDGGSGVYLYLATDLSANANIQLIKWATPTMSTSIAVGDGTLDEFFFFLSPSSSEATTTTTIRRVRQLTFVWPSLTATAPQLLALLVGADGSAPSQLVAADPMQRTFTPIQGMPFPTAHPAVIAASGVGIGRAVLVAAYGSDLFTLPVSYCASSTTTSSGVTVPRYWDGAACQRHACVRARSCNSAFGQTWSNLLFKCVCMPGWYATSTTTTLVCAQCAPVSYQTTLLGYYCPGNGTRVACPYSMTSSIGATSVGACICRDGQHYNARQLSCQTCPAGAWCPNQWSLVPCPGTVDTARSSNGLIYPQGCVCAAGATGAQCSRCPPGRYCPSGTTATAVNSALLLTLASASAAAALCPPSASSVGQAFMQQILAPYLAAGSLSFLNDASQQDYRLLCQTVLPPDERPALPAIVALMFQTDTMQQAANSLLAGLPALLTNNATRASTGIVAVKPALSPSVQQVMSNAVMQCPSGQTPDVDTATTCACAPGFETNGYDCSACVVGRYKAAAGAGTCTACPIGATTVAAGGTACIVSSPGGNNNNNNNNNGTSTSSAGGASSTTVLVVAGVVGGVAVVGLTIWAASMLLAA